MTQTELGEYVKDIQNDIEDDLNENFIITFTENANGYGYTLVFKNKNSSNSCRSMMPTQLTRSLVQRIESIFELDFDIELIWGSVNGSGTSMIESYYSWANFKQRLKTPIESFSISIGKIQRRIKKFNRNI